MNPSFAATHEPEESRSALTHAISRPVLMVRQKKEWGEILTGFETKNRYQVTDDEANPLLFAAEVGGGFFGWLLRIFLKGNRPFSMHLFSPRNALVLVLKRPFRFFFSRLEVADGGGRALGAIQQRFKFFGRRYELQDPGGEVLAELHGPFFKPWTFLLMRGDLEEGRIEKKWSGLGKELFTDADNFRIGLGDRHDERLRALTLSASFLIDFVHFENRG